MTSELRHNTDKRVIRTKKSIKYALFKLLETKELSAITISELTSVANVNRRTFYTHYRCVTDILDEVENNLVTALTEMLTNIDLNDIGNSIEKMFIQMHEIFTIKFDFYFRLMKLDARAYLLARLKIAFKNSIVMLPRENSAIDPESSLSASFVAGGILAFYSEWYYSDDHIPLEQAAKLAAALAVSCHNVIKNQ